MKELPDDGEMASIGRGKETGIFNFFNPGLVHVYVRTAGNILHRRSFGSYSILK